jgi:phosphate butyryltransferase
VNVACLAANEKVDPHIPSTVDAAMIAEAWRSGEFDDLQCTCTVEGPMALDVVASMKAAEHKGIKSVIAGKVDLTLVPNIECGNVHCKTLTHYCHAQLAGLVLGAKVPIVLVSRSDTPETKFMSMALACIISQGI